jgi:FAD/FMN-containing dehydrogenase
LQVTTTTGAHTVLEEAAVQQLEASLHGEMFRPGHAKYDEARKVWNGMIDKRPALIVRCAGVADVIDAVKFARDHDLLVSVRGGGHNIAGKAVCNGGLMIDLSRMRSVQVDPDKRTARVEGGATLGDLDHETQAFGLATTAGVVTHTGMAGLTLGGGIGRIGRKYGLACDNVLTVDLVNAEGQFLRARYSERGPAWGTRWRRNWASLRLRVSIHPIGPWQ